MEEPGGLQSMGSQRVWHNWVTLLQSMESQKVGQEWSDLAHTPHPKIKVQFSSVQLCSFVWLCDPRNHSMLGPPSITNSQSLHKLVSIESVMPSSHLILYRPLFLLPSIPPSIWVFSNESTLHMRWTKYWSFSFNISPSNEHPRLISFRMYWLDLLAVQGTLKSLLQHHSSKASILWHSAFFTVQLTIHTWPLEKPEPWQYGLLMTK